MNAKESIGLLFGSFNPIHHGHLMVANYLVEYTFLNKIWFIVSPQNPFKTTNSLLDENIRYEMTQMAISDNPNFYASAIEIDMPKPSYTINTLTTLKEKFPDKEFILICGTDILPHFHQWKNHLQIMENFRIMVYNRPGEYPHNYDQHPAFQFIQAPSFDISSRFIRSAIKEGKSPKYLLPDSVHQYILDHKLFL